MTLREAREGLAEADRIQRLANQPTVLPALREELLRTAALLRESFTAGADDAEAAACAIWWLTQQDEDAIGPAAPEDWPIWLRAEYRSLCGRPRRGRLWVSALFPGFSGIPWPDPETPLARRLGDSAGKYSAGGIVVSANVLPLLADMPGMLTDLSLHRLGLPDAAAARLAGIREAVLCNGSAPWPLLDVLRILAEAAEHLHDTWGSVLRVAEGPETGLAGRLAADRTALGASFALLGDAESRPCLLLPPIPSEES